MAFNPEIQPVIQTGQISASQGVKPNDAFGELFKGLGDSMSNFLQAKMESDKASLSLAASDSADALAQELLSGQQKAPQQNVPGEVANKIAEVNRYASAAKAKPDLTQHVYTKALATSKDLKAKYPHLRDYVDSELSSAIGSNFGIKLAEQNAALEDAANATISNEIKFNRQYAKENDAEIAYAKELGLLPKEMDFSSGNFDMSKVAGVIGGIKAKKLMMENGKMAADQNKDLAFTEAQKATTVFIAESLNKASTGKAYQDALQSAMSDGKVSAEEAKNLKVLFGSYEQEMNINFETRVLSQFPNLDGGQMEAVRKRYANVMGAMRNYIDNPNTGVLNMQKQYNDDVIQGKVNEALTNPVVATRAAMDQLGFDRQTTDAAMNEFNKANGGSDYFAFDLFGRLATQKETSIQDSVAAMRAAGKTDVQIADSIKKVVEQSANILSDPNNSNETLDTIYQNLYTTSEGRDVINKYASKNPLEMFRKFYSPEITQKVMTSKYAGDYFKSASQQFEVIAKPVADGVRELNGYYGLTYDPATGHFGIGDKITYDWQDTKVKNEIDKLNTYADYMKPIVEGMGGKIGDFVQTKVGGSEELKKTNIFQDIMKAITTGQQQDRPAGGPKNRDPLPKAKDQQGSLDVMSADKFLASVSDKPMEAIQGLDDNFSVSLASLINSAPPEIQAGLGVYSAKRSSERQTQLWNAALVKYGSAEAARKWVAPPGHSKHEQGLAADLSWEGKSLREAPAWVVAWVHQNAAEHGLTFPLGNENWHIEPIGARKKKKTQVASK